MPGRGTIAGYSRFGLFGLKKVQAWEACWPIAGPASESRSRRPGRLAEVDLRKVCRRKLEEVLCRRSGNEDPDSTELAFPLALIPFLTSATLQVAT